MTIGKAFTPHPYSLTHKSTLSKLISSAHANTHACNSFCISLIRIRYTVFATNLSDGLQTSHTPFASLGTVADEAGLGCPYCHRQQQQRETQAARCRHRNGHDGWSRSSSLCHGVSCSLKQHRSVSTVRETILDETTLSLSRAKFRKNLKGLAVVVLCPGDGLLMSV